MASDDILELNTLRHYDRLGCNQEKRQMYEVGLSLDNLDEPDRERESSARCTCKKKKKEAKLNFFFFFFPLRGHNQRVDFSGAYNSSSALELSSFPHPC